MIKDFLKNTNLDGYKYLMEPRRSNLEKLMWSIFHLLLLTSLIYLVYILGVEYANDPIITTLVETDYPISEVDPPGITVCNINKISKKKALKYAQELRKKCSSQKRSIDEIMGYLQHLGSLYDFDYTDSEKLREAQEFLNLCDPDPTMGRFNVNKGLKMLITSCEEFIEDCELRGNNNCSEIFSMEKTMEGYCCVLKLYEDTSKPSIDDDLKDHHDHDSESSSGIENSLHFHINVDLDDYMYTVIASEGANLLIYSRGDFADTSSGSLIETLIPMGVNMRITISAEKVYSVSKLKAYSINKRNCYFEDEETLYYGRYSYSDCLLICRMESILRLCECIPFFLKKPTVSTKTRGADLQCTLLDVPCLNKFKDKWLRMYPRNYEDTDLDMEKDHSLRCDHCYVGCGSIEYFVHSEYFPIWTKINEDTNYTVVDIYYENKEVFLYRTEPMYTWADALSNIGGICGLCMGFSLINVIEIFFYFTLRFTASISRKIRQLKRQFIARNKPERKAKTKSDAVNLKRF